MELDIFQLPGIIRRRLYYVVLSLLACVALAFAYLSTIVPLYRTATEILLDPQGLVAERSNLFINGAAPQEQPSLDSQTYIVLSGEVLGKVIDQLSLAEDPYFLKAIKVPADAGPEARRAALLAAITKHLRVERAGQSLILSITAEHPDPARAALIANTIADTYLKTTADARAEANRRASESFQTQASELRDRVLKAELAVENFRAENGLVSTGERGLLVDQQVVGINEQLTAARLAEEDQKSKYDQARNLTIAAIEAGAIPEAAQSPAIELLRSRYTQLLDRETELASGLGANHPQLRAVRSQLAGARQSLDAEIGRVRENLRASYERAVANTNAISTRLARLTRTSFDSGAAMTRMRQLESDAQAVRAIYTTFLTRAEELGQTQGLNTNNSRVISVATPPAATPGGLKKVVLIAAALFGAALGSGLAVIHELIARMSKPTAAGARIAGLPVELPVIATLPPETLERKGLSRFLPGGRKKAEIANDQRLREIGLLRSVHFLLNTYGKQRPVTITFIAPGETPPRTDLVSEIATTLADLGQDVAFASGALAETAPRAERRPQKRLHGMLAARLRADENENEPLLAENLVYTRLTATEGTDGQSGSIGMADFVIIDACGTPAADFLPLLIEASDALVVVTDLSALKKGDLETLLSGLDAWREKIPGRIVVGALA